MERNKYAFGFKEVPAADIVEGAVAAVRERFNVPGCQFKTVAPANLPPVMDDPDAIVTAVVNLLDNAYKYSGDNKRITLTAAAVNGSVLFSVEDNGIGLSPRDTRRIFKRFYRAQSAKTKQVKGTGLGLFIVRSVARRYGGEAYAESAGEGHGSTFFVKLPRVYRA